MMMFNTRQMAFKNAIHGSFITRSLTKEVEKPKTPRPSIVQKKKPLMLMSEYGELLNVKPMIKTKAEVVYREVQMIDGNSDAKTLLKKLHTNPNCYFLYDPKSHFTNAQTLYGAMKKVVNEKYYGRKGKKVSSDKVGSGMKGTVFEDCQLPHELFNVNRMVKMNSKQMLSRLGFLTLRDGTIEVLGKNKPEIVDFKLLLQQLESEFDLGQSFAKPDYFASFPFVEGVISADTMKTNGIKIKCLQDKLIYPLYGVWSPTSQEYLDLFSNYVSQSQSVIRSYQTMADLGCGTGILPIVLSQNGAFTGRVYSFDKESNCIEATKMNSQIFGIGDRVKPIELDVIDFYMPKPSQQNTKGQIEFYKSITSELDIPMQFDLITCNPPWIPAEYIAESSPLDNGVYDPKEHFLNSALNFAKLHLSPSGEMLLIYSDLASMLGLQEENRVQTLANMFGLRAELVDKVGMQASKRINDPLKNIKKDAKVHLYRVTK